MLTTEIIKDDKGKIISDDDPQSLLSAYGYRFNVSLTTDLALILVLMQVSSWGSLFISYEKRNVIQDCIWGNTKTLASG